MQTVANSINSVLEAELSQTGLPRVGPEQVKVLLIEDNPGDARLIEIMLAEEAGTLFEVEWLDRLGPGLQRLAEGGIGLVLVDLSLPDSQGLETFLQLHERVPGLPIIVLSGLRDTTVALEAVHEGAQDFLIKGQVDGPLLVRSMRYAIERKRMSEQLGRYAEELRMKNAQLEADFNMAREIQQIFLPHQYPVVPSGVEPQRSVLKFAHLYLPAAAVGGDFFDILPVGQSAAGVFICDVIGHGMRAALVTAIMRGLVEELTPAAHDPGRFLSEINRNLHTILKRTSEPLMVTAFYLVADAANGELLFSSAGHPSPVRVRDNGKRVELFKSLDPRHGPALGLFEKPVFPTCRFEMAPGDLFLLFTDGIFEADDAGGEEYGTRRLLEALQHRAGTNRQQLLQSLVDEVRDYTGDEEFKDDVCLVAVEVAAS